MAEKENQVVRFHAAQSVVVAIVEIVAWVAFMILSQIPVLGFLFIWVELWTQDLTFEFILTREYLPTVVVNSVVAAPFSRARLYSSRAEA